MGLVYNFGSAAVMIRRSMNRPFGLVWAAKQIKRAQTGMLVVDLQMGEMGSGSSLPAGRLRALDGMLCPECLAKCQERRTWFAEGRRLNVPWWTTK